MHTDYAPLKILHFMGFFIKFNSLGVTILSSEAHLLRHFVTPIHWRERKINP